MCRRLPPAYLPILLVCSVITAVVANRLVGPIIARRVARVLGPSNYSRLAREALLDRPHVSRILRGKCGVSLWVAKRIAVCAGVTLDQLYWYIANQVAEEVSDGSSRAPSSAAQSRSFVAGNRTLEIPADARYDRKYVLSLK